MNSLSGRLQTFPLVLKVALILLPMIIWLTRGKFGTGRIAYQIYSIMPLTMWALAARSSRKVAVSAQVPADRALLHMISNRFAFDAGERLHEWEAATERALTFCDDAIMRQAPNDEVAELIFNALLLLYHPKVHQGSQPSPFVDSPEATYRLMSHACIRLLQGTPLEVSSLRRVPSEKEQALGRPINLLVLTDTNFNFMGPILDYWESDSRVNLRARNLRAESVDSEWWNPRNTILDRLNGCSPAPPPFLRQDLLWADVIFLEWSEALAARLSGVDLSARLFVRLHRYEAFNATPSLTNWSNVEALVTITPYMTTLLDRTVPDILSRTRICMVPNVTDLRPFDLPKLKGASRTIGVVQYASILKDPMWALDVLELLQQQDPTWRLAFIGSPYSGADPSDASDRYFVDFERRAASFGDAIQFLGHRSDLAESLRAIGVILSASRVEGAPVSVQEGLASGAFPVIRNWPIVKAIGAAESLYPPEWIVNTPAEGAARILSWAGDVQSIVDETQSRNWVIENFDAEVTRVELNRIVLQLDAPTPD